ncbi:MAG: TonB-dependent receptor [Acidobacteria bacterium]|nr:TonB-dependent receptor [Acidobacteriota bacterium]
MRGRLSQQLAASRDFSSGFIPNRDYRNLSLASTTSLAARPGITTLDLGYADRPFGAQNFYGLYPSWERTKTWYSGLRQSLGEHTEAAFSFRRHTDLFYLFRDQPQRYQNHHAAESWQLSLRRRQPLRSNTALFYGAEGFGDSIQSSNLGRHSRARATAYTALDLRSLRRFSLTAGLRTESFRGVVDQISPSLSAALYAAPRLKLRAAASRAYRLPSFTELYYKDPANQGNSALLMESSWSHETGLDYSPSAAWRITTTLFHRRDRHGIDYTSAFATGPWTAANISALNFTGLESAASWQRRGHVVDFSYTALRGLSQLPPGVFTKYSFNYPIHSGVASWTGSLPGRLTARARLGALERRVRSPYALWDLYLARPHRRLSPFLQFTNLAGVRYQEIPGVAMPGRACLLGLELSLRP